MVKAFHLKIVFWEGYFFSSFLVCVVSMFSVCLSWSFLGPTFFSLRGFAPAPSGATEGEKHRPPKDFGHWALASTLVYFFRFVFGFHSFEVSLLPVLFFFELSFFLEGFLFLEGICSSKLGWFT